MDFDHALNYRDIPSFLYLPRISRWTLVFGEFAGRRVAIMQGRLHLYGLSAEIAFPSAWQKHWRNQAFGNQAAALLILPLIPQMR